MSSYEDITAVMTDRRIGVDRTQTPLFHKLIRRDAIDPEFFDAITGSLVMSDAPDHTRLRRLVKKAFTPRTAQQLRPRIERLVDELLDSMLEKEAQRVGSVDFMRDFAYPLPVIVIAEMLGIPSKDHDLLKEWSDGLSAILDLMQTPGGLETAQSAYRSLAEYFPRHLRGQAVQPQGRSVSSLVRVEEEGDRLSEAELLSICMLILGAGHETTSNLLGNGLWALLQNPEQAQRLRRQPELASSAIDELLRFDSPVQMTDRVVLEDLEIGAASNHPVTARKGQLIGILYGAANRDPARFEHPDELRLDRPNNRHLAFSWGPHYCLGAALAKVEAEIAFSRLLGRFPELSGPTTAPARGRSHILRGFKQLPIRLGPQTPQSSSPARPADIGIEILTGQQGTEERKGVCPFHSNSAATDDSQTQAPSAASANVEDDG